MPHMREAMDKWKNGKVLVIERDELPLCELERQRFAVTGVYSEQPFPKDEFLYLVYHAQCVSGVSFIYMKGVTEQFIQSMNYIFSEIGSKIRMMREFTDSKGLPLSHPEAFIPGPKSAKGFKK